MRSSFALVALVASSFLTPHTVARAQDDADPEATQRARELFAEGVALTADESYEEAVARFREAYAIRQAPTITYNLAVALVELGQVTEASELLSAVLEDDEAARDVKRLARRLERRVDRTIGQLTVSLLQSRGSATIHVDGRVLGDDELGVPIPIDPGAHVVTAERSGTVLEQQEHEVEAGQSVDVTLNPSSWPGASLDPELYEAPPDDEPDDEAGGSIFTRWWFWTVVGVVVIGGAILIGVAASGAEGPLDGNTNPAVVRF